MCFFVCWKIGFSDFDFGQVLFFGVAWIGFAFWRPSWILCAPSWVRFCTSLCSRTRCALFCANQSSSSLVCQWNLYAQDAFWASCIVRRRFSRNNKDASNKSQLEEHAKSPPQTATPPTPEAPRNQPRKIRPARVSRDTRNSWRTYEPTRSSDK